MRWWPLIKQFPKYALVFGVVGGSTVLFGFWWMFHSSQKAAALHLQPVEDIRPKLALIEAKWDHLILADNDLYDVDDGRLIFKNWLQQGVPLQLFYDAEPKKIIARYEQGFIRYGLDGREVARLVQKEKPGLAPDWKSVVFARDKEVWRADVDWKAFKFTNEKKVTSIEQFHETNFAENIQLLTNETLVIRNLNNLLRVNLETGEVHPTRIPLGNIGKRRSPDSKWVVGMEGGQFYCYDVDADEAKSIPLARNSALEDFQWLSTDHCLGLAGGKTVALYDRPAHSLTKVTTLPISCFKMGEPSPDGRFVFCAGGIDGRNGVLVDVKEKTAERITGGAGICWVSDDTFAFSREVPDSSMRGTWLQTVGHMDRRVMAEPYLVVDPGAQLMTLASNGLIILQTHDFLSTITVHSLERTILKRTNHRMHLLNINLWALSKS